jgi:hypothetical protein
VEAEAAEERSYTNEGKRKCWMSAEVFRFGRKGEEGRRDQRQRTNIFGRRIGRASILVICKLLK